MNSVFCAFNCSLLLDVQLATSRIHCDTLAWSVLAAVTQLFIQRMPCTVSQFLSRDMPLQPARCRMSVRCHTPVFCRNSYIRILKLFHHQVATPSSPCYSFSTPKRYGNILTVTQGRQMRGAMEKSRFSTNISLFLGNDTRQSYTYSGRPI